MNAFSKFLIAAALIPVSLFLTSCEGGGSDSDRRGPNSLSGVTLTFTNFGGSSMDFIASRGQTGPIEIGGITNYTKGADGEVTLIPSSGGGTLQRFQFPDQFDAASYRFTPIGESSGVIEFWGDSVIFDPDPADIFANATPATPITLTVLFNDSGSAFIQSVEMLLETQVAGAILSGEFNSDIELTDGGSVPIGYSTDTGGFSEFTEGTFEGTFLQLTDNASGADQSFDRSFLFGATGTGSNRFDDDNPIREIGTVLVIDDLSDEQFEAVDYQTRQQRGTDDVTLELSFSAGTIDALPVDVIYTLTFLTVDAGTYVGDDGSSGSFDLSL